MSLTQRLWEKSDGARPDAVALGAYLIVGSARLREDGRSATSQPGVRGCFAVARNDRSYDDSVPTQFAVLTSSSAPLRIHGEGRVLRRRTGERSPR